MRRLLRACLLAALMGCGSPGTTPSPNTPIEIVQGDPAAAPGSLGSSRSSSP